MPGRRRCGLATNRISHGQCPPAATLTSIAGSLVCLSGTAVHSKDAMPMKIRPRWIILIVLIVLVLPVLGLGGWTWATLHFSYSEGERTGYVQMISKKG